MSTDAVAVLGFVALFALMLLRVPVGMAMGLVGVSGYQSRGESANAIATVDGQSVTQQETQEYQCEWEGEWGEQSGFVPAPFSAACSAPRCRRAAPRRSRATRHHRSRRRATRSPRRPRSTISAAT